MLSIGILDPNPGLKGRARARFSRRPPAPGEKRGVDALRLTQREAPPSMSPADRLPGCGAAVPPTSAPLGLAKTAVSCTSLLPACFGSGLRAATVGGTAAPHPASALKGLAEVAESIRECGRRACRRIQSVFCLLWIYMMDSCWCWGGSHSKHQRLLEARSAADTTACATAYTTKQSERAAPRTRRWSSERNTGWRSNRSNS